MDEVTFEIVEHIGVLGETAAGWKRELNLVSWCGRPATYDIRQWAPGHNNYSRGITLKEHELYRLEEIVAKFRKEKETR